MVPHTPCLNNNWGKTVEQGTPIKKLSGLEFFVYLYVLDTPRRYVGVSRQNNIGFGYYGRNADIRAGVERVERELGWLRENIDDLRHELGPQFPDLLQYTFFDRFDADFSVTANHHLMRRAECEEYISQVLMKRVPPIINLSKSGLPELPQ